MARPDLSRVPQFYHNYINQVPEDDIMSAFRQESPKAFEFFATLPDLKINFAYAPGKWTPKELVQHLIDAERVFTYRALRFARKDPSPLPGFDENIFAQHAQASGRSWQDLTQELKAVRKSSEWLFGSFNEEQLEQSGTSNNNSIYVLAIGYVVVGHVIHHTQIIRERYL